MLTGFAEKAPKIKHESGLKEKPIKHIKLDEVKDLFAVFEFKEEIGHGNFGLVVEAIEKSSSTHFAVKIVNKYAAGSLKLEEIQREIKILKSVTHPNIINLDRVYETGKKIYMVFELCNDNLFNKFKSCNAFPDKTIKKIIKQLVDAVYYLHRHDIVHRDIKMENILITKNPEDPNDELFIKLTDFGLSIKKAATGIQGMLRDRVGTIIYMAPEILLDHTYSELCDVWSIGVILFTMMYGKFPFMSTSQKELAGKIISFEPEFSTKMIDLDCVDLMKSTLVKDPVKRITAQEMLKHPWLFDNKIKVKTKNQTVIDYMKQWKTEMMLPGEESDWVSAYTTDRTSQYSNYSTAKSTGDKSAYSATS
ncbi:unnamed protein product [Psylliodes chrysocephalus]|uniref:Protein kinase domain-containing protein n=1 Tax=Psylliodes chrysocephalus TaxID=3402493 RepID=A0A9P0G6J1_9CUCU|nr:unnamed protein product [Psylliodes chrysocephala]